MPFSFDVSNPTDTYLIPSYPSNARLFRSAVFDMLEIEHDTAEGRHKFGVGADGARDAITTWGIGSLWFNTSHSPAILQRVLSVGPIVWENVNVDPDDGSGNSVLARLNAQSDFVVSQFGTYDQVTPAAGGPGDTLAIDLILSPFKYATIDDDTIISNPTNLLSGGNKGVTVVLDMTIDGVGGHAITWGTEYYSAGGSAPIINTTANARNLIYITKMQDLKYLVTTVAGISAV